MSTYYLTSFASDMYEASGKQLLASFVKSGTPGRMIVCHERLPANTLPTHMLSYDLAGDVFLQTWLQKFKHVIPTHLGGDAGECKCRGGPYTVHDKRHQMPCIGHWFNRNASRWFRKTASLRYAKDTIVRLSNEAGDVDPVLIWIDADCVFTKKLPAVTAAGFFRGTDVFFHKSKRPVLESGVVGYKVLRGGGEIITRTAERYMSGAFVKDTRWDDSFQLQMALKTCKHVPSTDLATKVGDHAAVIPYGPVGQYLVHHKGAHGRGLGIMT